MHLNLHTGPDGIHPGVLKELAVKLLESLSIISSHSWRNEKAPEDWQRENNVLIFQKGNYRPISLTSFPGENFYLIIGD